MRKAAFMLCSIGRRVWDNGAWGHYIHHLAVLRGCFMVTQARAYSKQLMESGMRAFLAESMTVMENFLGTTCCWLWLFPCAMSNWKC